MIAPTTNTPNRRNASSQPEIVTECLALADGAEVGTGAVAGFIDGYLQLGLLGDAGYAALQQLVLKCSLGGYDLRFGHRFRAHHLLKFFIGDELQRLVGFPQGEIMFVSIVG